MKHKSIFLTFVVLLPLLWAGRLPAADELLPTKTNDAKSESEGLDNPYVAGAVKGRDKTTGSDLVKYRVFLLRYISANEGIQVLTDANIKNVTQLNDANMLLVCGGGETLVKAASILDLVDSKEKYIFKVLMPVQETSRIPRPEEIAAEISNNGKPISIGTFLNMPGGEGYKVIMDIHEGQLVAVAPAVVMDKIAAIVERSRPESRDSAAVTGELSREPRTSVDEPNALFNELLGSIAEAEKEISKTMVSLADLKADLGAKGEGDESEPNQQKSIAAKHKEQQAEPNETTDDGRAAKDEKTRRTYEPLVIPNANETLELELPEKIQIVPLLDLMGKYLNLNYVYDEKKLIGMEVNLKVQGKIKVGELYPLVESVLKFTGLAMTRKGNLVTIIPIAEAMEIDPIWIDGQAGEVQAGDVVVSRIFQLHYIEPANAKVILEGMKVGAVTDLPGGTLIVTGYAYRMNRIEQLLEVIDKPGRPKQFKYRQLKYTMAKTLAPKVKGLVEQLGDISIAVATAQTPQPPSRIPRRPPTAMPQPTPTSETAKSTVYLDADERTNRILMIGQELELAVVNDLIDALDVAQQDLRAIRIYEIQHVDAQEVRKKLEELGIIGESREETPGRRRITSRAAAGPQQPGAPPQQAPIPTTGSGSETELPTEEMQVVVIESTNSLLVNASPEQHAMVATIIAYVDSESIQQAIPYVVYPLQNQPPEHVAEVLQKLIQEVVQDKEGKVQTVVKRTEENIIVVPDPNTFSLIVYANKKNQDWISSLIKTLDRRRPQVLIDVTLVEVTNKDNFDLDLQLASKFPKMLPGGQMDVLGAIVGGAGNEGDTTFLGRSREAYSNPKAGIAQGFYSDEHIQALLTAMETKSYGRVLAKPKILVNDGQVGVIKTTETKNVQITGQTIVGGTTSNIVTSTSYQPYEAGITLTIQPNISEGDLLLLLVKLDRTDFGAPVAAGPPDTLASTVDTIVTVPNNKTIILGGLLKLKQGKGGSKVPLLGDIPIIGGLFRSTSNSVDDSKLYVFVRANILRPEETLAGLPELERISDRNRAAFEKSEDEFQKYHDWPGIKPKPVDPLRVLDAE